MFNFLLINLFVTVATFFSVSYNVTPPPESITAVKWAVEKTSALTILGSSNLHDFQCDALGYAASDTISFVASQNNAGKIPLKGSLKIEINTINCHNFIITRNFRSTLKANEHPYLIVKFLSLERAPLFTNNKDNLKGIVEIELGGVSKKFEIPYKIQKNGHVVLLNGQRNFTFSDFEITPPRILGGLVKIYNKFNVEFNLKIIQTT
ncbi:MAG: hypothetical protein RL064_1279 [Bacteroidota bacterium]|jgi:hypothetical protein